LEDIIYLVSMTPNQATVLVGETCA